MPDVIKNLIIITLNAQSRCMARRDPHNPLITHLNLQLSPDFTVTTRRIRKELLIRPNCFSFLSSAQHGLKSEKSYEIQPSLVNRF